MRRYATVFVVAILFGSVLPLQIAAQQVPTLSHQRLGYWLGEWTYEVGNISGTVEGKWLEGGFFIEWRETNSNASSGVTTQLLHVLGYDVEDDAYTWHRYWGNGIMQSARGWVTDDTWTFVFDEHAGTQLRLIAIEESNRVMRFTWFQSVRGGPWEETGQGTMTKAR